MGEDTIEFASRFSAAVSELADLARADGYRALAAAHGSGLADRVRADLDAIVAVYETGTRAVRNWAEQSRRVLALVAQVRGALDSGSDEGVRRMAGALVETIRQGHGPKSPE